MTVVYKSIDNQIFDNEYDCLLHELKLILGYCTIEVLDKYDLPLENIWTDESYNKSQKVILKDSSDLIAIKRLQEFCGFYSNIDSVGTWIWNDDIWTREC